MIAASVRGSLPRTHYLQPCHPGRLISWPKKLTSKSQSIISRKQQDIWQNPLDGTMSSEAWAAALDVGPFRKVTGQNTLLLYSM